MTLVLVMSNNRDHSRTIIIKINIDNYLTLKKTIRFYNNYIYKLKDPLLLHNHFQHSLSFFKLIRTFCH
jgi:hypothetical protein